MHGVHGVPEIFPLETILLPLQLGNAHVMSVTITKNRPGLMQCRTDGELLGADVKMQLVNASG